MPSFLIATLIFAYTALAQDAAKPRVGTVVGRVLDAQGKGVAGAHVYAFLVDKPGMGGRFYAITDENGNFSLNRVLSGLNEIHAFKQEDGYPDNLFAFFSSARVPTVEMPSGGSVNDVIVRLGPTSGQLTGALVNSRSSTAISQATITLTREDNPQYYVKMGPDKDGHFRLLVPPLPFRVRVAATGFEAWQSSSIDIPSGATKSLKIELTPLRPPRR